MTDSRCEELLRVSDKLFSSFQPIRQLWQDSAENFHPIRADFTQTLNTADYAGYVMDGSPILARETLGNMIDAMLRQGTWFHMGTGSAERDKRPANAVGLDRGTDAMMSIIKRPGSGFADAFKEWDHDWVSFGTFCGSIQTSSDLNGIIAKAHHPRDVVWMDDEDGKTDTVFRNIAMTARAMVKRVESGRWSGVLSETVKEAARRDPGKEFQVRHALIPTDDVYGDDRTGRERTGKKPFLSIYLDVENRTYLNDAGSSVFNYVIGRSRRLAGKPWGFSPMALNSIRDAKMLQDMALVILEQGQKAVDPPTIGSGSVFTRDMNFFAGGHTEVDLELEQKLGDVFTTIETGRIDVGVQLKQDVRMLIAEAWLLNQLRFPAVPDMRELLVQVKMDEFRRAAIPFFNPIETNYHDLVLGVTYDVAAQARFIKADIFPDDLHGAGVTFTFDSPLADAEGQKIIQQFNTAISVMAASGQIEPTVKSIFDIRKATEDAIARGTRPEWIIPEDQREKADQEAAVQQQLAQAAQIAQGAAGVTSDVANASMAAQNAGLAPAPAA